MMSYMAELEKMQDAKNVVKAVCKKEIRAVREQFLELLLVASNGEQAEIDQQIVLLGRRLNELYSVLE